MTRLFERTTFHVPNTRPISGFRVTCCECGATEKVTTVTAGKVMAPEGIASKFRNKGWSIGTREGRDVCPECSSKRRKSQAKAHEEQGSNIIAMGTVTPIKAEPPREASREDKRVIFAKINDVYLDEEKGYDPPWTDAKVAEDLGVPVAWVRSVREDNFGIEGANGEINAVVSEAKQLMLEAKKFRDEAQEAYRQMTEQAEKRATERRQALAEMGAKITVLEKKLSDVLKALGK